MCLHNILGKPKNTEGIGYKAYYAISPTTMRDSQCNQYKLGNTYNSEKVQEITDDGKTYKTGFHIFKTIEDAYGWFGQDEKNTYIIKVSYKKARTEGTQKLIDYNRERETYRKVICSPCIIADEITLLEVVK